MSWEIKTRRPRRKSECCAYLKAQWTELSTIEDVTIDSGKGVRATGSAASSQRIMSAFSKPIEGVFQWEEDVAHPEVILTWTDTGVDFQQRVPLTPRPHPALPETVHRSFERVRGRVSEVFR